MFTIVGIGKAPRKSLFIMFLDLFPFALTNLVIIINLFANPIFSISDSGQYSQGPLYFLIYVCAFYYVFLSIFYTILYRKKISPNYFTACIVFNSMLFLGYVCRIIFPKYLIMNFFTLISIIIIYLSFQNPTLWLEEKSGLFNRKALEAIFREIKPNKNPMIIGFTLHNYNDLREIYSNTQIDACLFMIGNYLKHYFPKIKSFYMRDGRFVMFGKNSSEADFIRSKLYQRFESPWTNKENVDMYLEISVAQLNPEVFAYERDTVLTTLLTALNEITTNNQTINDIDAEDVKKIIVKKKVKRTIETAVEQNSVELFLQPLVDSQNHTLIAAEALARLHDSHGNMLSPTSFIPIAERNGRINALGEQIFTKTCKFIAEHDIEAMGLEWINVNLSPIQFLRPDLAKRFTSILQEYKIPAEKIHLEITEESMIDFDLLEKQMRTMMEAGFLFVLDDYGRGYSNMARMKKCPFTNVKLDMEFVWDYFKEKDKILPTLVHTIKQMGFTVTAEGIESNEMAAAMTEVGCDYLQGFTFSRPLSVEDFLAKYNS
jgi:EAL domain-containing protein (putative c-di-GMP-specific phosphodiesterase class I)